MGQGRPGEQVVQAGPLARLTVVAALAGASVVHATVVGEHLQEWAPAGLFFLCLVMLESALGVLAVLAWSRGVALMVLASGVATVAVWAVSRTVGMPIGPADFRIPEPVAAPDLVCGALELAAAAACAYSLAPRPASAGAGSPESGAVGLVLAGLVVAAVAAATVLGVYPAVTGGGGHHAQGAASALERSGPGAAS
jgi:hypothetical protein